MNSIIRHPKESQMFKTLPSSLIPSKIKKMRDRLYPVRGIKPRKHTNFPVKAESERYLGQSSVDL